MSGSFATWSGGRYRDTHAPTDAGEWVRKARADEHRCHRADHRYAVCAARSDAERSWAMSVLYTLTWLLAPPPRCADCEAYAHRRTSLCGDCFMGEPSP